jgi:hypothetical protein
MFPNPAGSTAYFTAAESVLKIYAHDMLGKVYPVEFSLSNELYQLNLLPLAEGVYILKFYTEKKQLAGQAKILRKN